MQLTQNLGDEGVDLTNEAGETLVFKNFMSALNYAIEKDDWEVFQISKINPFNGYFKTEQYAILRKIMKKDESTVYRESSIK